MGVEQAEGLCWNRQTTMLRKFIKRYLKKRGLQIAPMNGPTFDGALKRLRARNIRFGTILDVGASDGRWTRSVLKHFPHANYFCIEAQSVHQPALKQLCAEHPNVGYLISAAGGEEGKVYFWDKDPFGGVASHEPLGKDCAVLPMTTIDAQVRQRKLEPPFLIKLDTHGFEVPILTGAAESLLQTEALMIEVYNFASRPPALPFHEMCAYLAERQFRCVDLYDPLYRPRDNVLWQMDMVFLRASRPEFQSRGFL